MSAETPPYTTISQYHLNKLNEAILELDEHNLELIEEMGKLIAQRDEAREWAKRFYKGWEHNDGLLPVWLKEV